MAEEVKPVEPVAGTETDWEAEYKAQAERLAKAEKAAADYRKSYKLAKKEAVIEEAVDQPDPVEIAKQAAREVLAESAVLDEKNKLEALNLKMARELKEAKVALNNKAGMAATSAGSGQGGAVEAKSGFWSAEQVAEMKKRGFSDEMIKTAAQRAAAR